MGRNDDPSSNGVIAQILLEFLEVAISSIVFLKGIYPSGAFERRRYMNLVVQRAYHPDLRDYIYSSLSRLLPFIEKGMVERVAVLFFDAAHVPLERFVFKLALNQLNDSKVEEASLELALRSLLIKLSVSEPLTRVLAQNCSWEINGYFRSLPEAGPSQDAEFWVLADTKQWEQPPSITPIKSMSCEPLCVQLYLEHPSLNESKP